MMLTKRSLFAMSLFVVAGNAAAIEATYTVEFETLWNPSDHPNNYPSSAHFSPLIGASHSDAVRFWAPGESASAGIERLAELGSNGVFRSEIDAAVGAGSALERVEIGSNLFSGQSATSSAFTVDAANPLVTFATMVAPSSDWFVGVHDLNLRDGLGFVDELVFEFAHFYDAGTEEGNRFSLSNPATNPRGVISLVSGSEAAAPFHGIGATTLTPIARLRLSRQSLTGSPGDFDGDGQVTAADAAVWTADYGKQGTSAADANGDGVVNVVDYTIYRDALAGQAVSLPEPGAAFLALAAGLLYRVSRTR